VEHGHLTMCTKVIRHYLTDSLKGI
jgi:hypothetical protein